MKKIFLQTKMPDYFVALDLETTGIDREKDKIIEIGAIKFDQNRVIDRFETLINPEMPIPQIASFITGIYAQDTENAPLIQDQIASLKEFIGDYPIIGHFVHFDTEFLAANGLPLNNAIFDTFYLSTILLPNLSSYSLETISRQFNFQHENKHRAADDALASMHLFRIILEQISAIEPTKKSEIKTLLTKSTWSAAQLFTEEKFSHNKESSLNRIEIEKSEIEITENESSKKILNSLQENQNLIIEDNFSENNLSKILIPVAKYANENPEAKFLLLINSLNKKIKPIEKLLTKIQEKHNPNLHSVFISNCENYLDEKLFTEFLKKETFNDSESSLILKIILQLKSSKHKFIHEIKLSDEEYAIFQTLSCTSENDSFLKILKEKNTANLKITSYKNFIDILTKTQIEAPEFTHLIITQAGKFKKQIQLQSTEQVKIDDFINIIKTSKLDTQSKDQLASKFEIAFGLSGIFFETESLIQKNNYQIDLTNDHLNQKQFQQIIESLKNAYQEAIEKLELQNQKSTSHLISQNFKKFLKIIEKISDPLYAKHLVKQKSSMIFKSMNLQIIDHFSEFLEKKNPQILLSDSSLDINDNFNFTLKSLKLKIKFNKFKIPTSEVFINTIVDLPPPSAANFQEECENWLTNFFQENQQHTFILANSKRAMEQIFQTLKSKLDSQKFNIQGQNSTGSFGKIIENLDSGKINITIGSQILWQEIDLKTHQQSVLIIQKLPFEIISDPIIKHESQFLNNSFLELLLPQAVLKFKEIIRKFDSSHYPFEIFVLDQRLKTSKFGQNFLDNCK
jgi:DNA polymerase III epsilon subunit family exonuclease